MKNNSSRNIKDIAPLLATHFMDEDIASSVITDYQKLVADNQDRIGPFFKYLGHLHDSKIMQTEITDAAFSITLNDFTTHVFADAIVEKKSLDINHNELVFPVKFDFTQVTALTFNTIDEDGNIHETKPTSVQEYLYDQAISIDKNSISIGIVAWQNSVKGRRGKHILILFTATNILLHEMQDKAWHDIFGSEFDGYFSYFKAQRSKGRFLSDQTKCNELLDEYDGLSSTVHISA